MTRIIAGFAGSLRLKVPRSGTRPTSDRVREAIFSALQSRDALLGAHVLDLYAGSGALGLEAASRGATAITLVESAPDAARTCKENAAVVARNAPTDRKPTITVAAQSVQTFLGTSAGSWNLVFVDPPYSLTDDELQSALAALVPQLTSDAIVVVERAAKQKEPAWPLGLTLDRQRDYGDTWLWWLAR